MKKRLFILIIMVLVLITGCSFNKQVKIKEVKVEVPVEKEVIKEAIDFIKEGEV